MRKVAAVFGAEDVLLNGPKLQNGRAKKYSQSGDMRQRVLVCEHNGLMRVIMMTAHHEDSMTFI